MIGDRGVKKQESVSANRNIYPSERLPHGSFSVDAD
jgi:hypothetical protein